MIERRPVSGDSPAYDVICVGAGLANGLAAAALLHRHPSARVALVDARPGLTYEQTWCFHATDVADEDVWQWLDAFVAKRWDGHEVVFPGYRRSFAGAYLSITAESFAHALRKAAARAEFMLGTTVAEVGANQVTLADGRSLTAHVVLDGRGGSTHGSRAGYQKFVGLEVDLDDAAADVPERPVLMDATVAQKDGYRFMYLLPFGARRMLVEDTYFSSSADLDEDAVVCRIEQELARRKWAVRQVVRRERGVLPMPWQDGRAATPFPGSGVIKTGYGGGWYQPATGYSMPLAVAVAQRLATIDRFDAEEAKRALEPLWQRHRTQTRFYRLLNRLAFRGVRDDDRLGVFERFYRLPEALIARFYAGRSTWWDRVRILGGRPPVPLSRFQVARLMEEVS